MLVKVRRYLVAYLVCTNFMNAWSSWQYLNCLKYAELAQVSKRMIKPKKVIPAQLVIIAKFSF